MECNKGSACQPKADIWKQDSDRSTVCNRIIHKGNRNPFGFPFIEKYAEELFEQTHVTPIKEIAMKNDEGNIRHLSNRSLHVYEETVISDFENQLKRDRTKQLVKAGIFLFTAGAILAVCLYISVSLEPVLAKFLGG